MNVKVKIHWDDEAEVWVAICDDLGIALESGSYDALIEKVRVAIHEMVELNEINNIKSIEVSTNKDAKETLEAMKEYEEGKSIGPFHSVKDFMADLHS